MSAGGDIAAILLSLVGEEEAAALIGELDAGEVTQLCSAMERLPKVGEAEIEAALADFITRARAGNPVASAGAKPLRTALERSLGSGRAQTLLGTGSEHRVFAQLGWLSARDVAELVTHEHPQLAAIVLGHVDPGVAAQALAELPDATASDLLHRLATLGAVGSDALDDLADILASMSVAPPRVEVETPGVSRVAGILNRSERARADRAFKALSKLDRTLAQAIDAERVVFADVVALADKDLGSVVRSADPAILARALKGVDAPTRDRFLVAMSARAGQSLRDEIDQLAGLSRADVEAAQATLVGIARRLGDDGAIRVGGEAAYV